MNKVDLNERLAYFEGRLKDAQARAALKEPHPRSFDAGYTTDVFKTWAETIKLLNARIASIQEQLKVK